MSTYSRQIAVLGLLACLVSTPAFAVDPAAYVDVLRHVDDHGMVDYVALKADPARLDAYLGELANAKLDPLDAQEKLATLINAYNAFTLKLISERYPIASIKDIPEAERWKAVRWNLGGTLTSLDAIEHQMIRAKFNEPRIHFALVCAGKGCPPLRNEPYVGSTLDEQLNDQMKKTHAGNGQWVSYDPATRTLTLTAIYQWFAGDFTKDGKPLADWVARFNPSVAEAQRTGAPLKIEYAPYDWALNAR